MPEIETNLGQIFIINKKLSKSFVCLLSEKLASSKSEIYTLVETPILNAQAWPEYERTAKALQSALRKNFLTPNPNAFENSIAEINDFLSRLAAKGQAAWIGKFNACVAARQNEKLFVSSSGKIHAYLLRDKQFSDIADAPKITNPLKVFENFAAGKVLKNDFIIFTTSQLFNFVSIERVRDILLKNDLDRASRDIAAIVSQISDPTISFGTLILQLGEQGSFHQVKQGKADSPEITAIKPRGLQAAGFAALGAAALKTKTLIKNFWQRLVQIRRPKVNLKDLSPVLLAQHARQLADISKIKELPKLKKFFLISAGVFILVLLVNVVVAVKLRGQRQQTEDTAAAFQNVLNKINDANSAFIYNDKNSAVKSLENAKTELAKIDKNNKTAEKINSYNAEIISLQNTVNGLKNANLRELATNSNAPADKIFLIGDTLYLLNNQASAINAFNTKNEHFGTEIRLQNLPQVQTIAASDSGLYFLDQDGALYQLDLINKSVIKQNNILGTGNTMMSLYGSPFKVYTLNKQQNTILTAATNGNTETKRYLKQNDDLSQALDLAIDGSIYVLAPDQIKKYTLGLSQGFLETKMSFSTQSKIKANSNWGSVYLLDPVNKLIILFDKNGRVKNQYTSERLSAAKDIAITADGKSAYLLIDQQIFKLAF